MRAEVLVQAIKVLLNLSVVLRPPSDACVSLTVNARVDGLLLFLQPVHIFGVKSRVQRRERILEVSQRATVLDLVGDVFLNLLQLLLQRMEKVRYLFLYPLLKQFWFQFIYFAKIRH